MVYVMDCLDLVPSYSNFGGVYSNIMVQIIYTLRYHI
jgi:hypothetical protein